MFAYGTNDYGKTRCYKNRTCTCLCETLADQNGTCTQISHSGYRLYRYVEKGKLKQPNTFIKDTFVINSCKLQMMRKYPRLSCFRFKVLLRS